MGRRNRKNRDSEDEGIDKAELEWMRKRQKTTNNDNDTTSSDINKEPKANDVSKSSTTATTSEEQDKIERMRLKKLRKKARQKEKKMAFKQEESRQQSKRQAEKALHDKQKKDLEKKKKKLKKETGSQQYKTLAKGVKYHDLVIGKGMLIQHRKKVRVSYTLRSKSHTSGKIIDSSHNFGFRVGKGEVIKGWDIGLEGMKVGGSRRLIVPPGAGYGNKDIGAGKGGDLNFQIELYMLLLEIHTCDLSEYNKGEPNIKIANIKSFENLSNLKVRLQESSI